MNFYIKNSPGLLSKEVKIMGLKEIFNNAKNKAKQETLKEELKPEKINELIEKQEQKLDRAGFSNSEKADIFQAFAKGFAEKSKSLSSKNLEK